MWGWGNKWKVWVGEVRGDGGKCELASICDNESERVKYEREREREREKQHFSCFFSRQRNHTHL